MFSYLESYDDKKSRKLIRDISKDASPEQVKLISKIVSAVVR